MRDTAADPGRCAPGTARTRRPPVFRAPTRTPSQGPAPRNPGRTPRVLRLLAAAVLFGRRPTPSPSASSGSSSPVPRPRHPPPPTPYPERGDRTAAAGPLPAARPCLPSRPRRRRARCPSSAASSGAATSAAEPPARDPRSPTPTPHRHTRTHVRALRP